MRFVIRRTLFPVALLFLLAGTTAGSCPNKTDPSDAGTGADGAAGSGTACYIADQFRCKEFPNPSEDQRNNLAVECSSGSGVLSDKCPTANYKAKCTVPPDPNNPKDGPEVRRWYTGRDIAYEEAFCADPAHGAWSTSF
jgi:hypothetical protein